MLAKEPSDRDRAVRRVRGSDSWRPTAEHPDPFLEALRAAHPYAALGLSLAEAVAAGAGKKAVEAKPRIFSLQACCDVVVAASCETGL